MDYFGVEASDFPALRILSVKDDKRHLTYKYDGDMKKLTNKNF